MKTRRALGLAVALIAVAVVSVGCTGTIGPALSSPITGSSDVLFSPGFPPDYQTQHANFSLCSLRGGPVTLHVHIPDASSTTGLSVFSGVEPVLFSVNQGASVDNEFTSSISLAPRECAVVQITVTNGGNGNPAPPFSYTVWW
jgi:hypothetical protein